MLLVGVRQVEELKANNLVKSGQVILTLHPVYATPKYQE